MTDRPVLNEYGLVGEARSLISWIKEVRKAEQLFNDARNAFESSKNALKECRIRLGENAKANGRPDVIHIPELPGCIIIIPVPPVGYTDYEIKEQIVHLTKVGEFKESKT